MIVQQIKHRFNIQTSFEIEFGELNEKFIKRLLKIYETRNIINTLFLILIVLSILFLINISDTA